MGTQPTDPVSLDFETVYRRHLVFIWRSLRRWGVPEADLEDAVHDVFLTYRRKQVDYDPARSSVGTWLYMLARGEARNRYRRRCTVRRHRDELLVPSPPEDPEGRVGQIERAQVMERFLRTLPRERREVFELSVIEGFRGPEIAGMLGVNPNTVHTRLRAARGLFRSYMSDHFDAKKGN